MGERIRNASPKGGMVGKRRVLDTGVKEDGAIVLKFCKIFLKNLKMGC